MGTKAKTPTDLEILNFIYDSYYQTYIDFDKDHPKRESKIYVPIDIDKIACSLQVDTDIVFGRLYYHLNNKFSYIKDGVAVSFFQNSILGSIGGVGQITRVVVKEKHSINFPYMASVLAELRDENKKYSTSIKLSWISLVVSLLAIIISIITAK